MRRLRAEDSQGVGEMSTWLHRELVVTYLCEFCGSAPVSGEKWSDCEACERARRPPEPPGWWQAAARAKGLRMVACGSCGARGAARPGHRKCAPCRWRVPRAGLFTDEGYAAAQRIPRAGPHPTPKKGG